MQLPELFLADVLYNDGNTSLGLEKKNLLFGL